MTVGKRAACHVTAIDRGACRWYRTDTAYTLACLPS
jgi:hypothetical protein